MQPRFDAIVIGSGFGGAITACRVAEKGMKVLVLERGRRWAPADYPRGPGDAWLFSADRPARQNGWLDLRFFRNMTVAQAAGVGGGSLAYSSVALEAHPSLFTNGWPREITYDDLKPCYDRVTQMMNLQVVPDGQITQRFKLAQEAAEKIGHGNRFSKTSLAVSFSPDWNYQLNDPFNPRHSRTFTNAHGQQQGTCIHLAPASRSQQVLDRALLLDVLAAEFEYNLTFGEKKTGWLMSRKSWVFSNRSLASIFSPSTPITLIAIPRTSISRSDAIDENALE